MWEEIYLWLEQYSGVSYDFQGDVSKISDNSIFIEPYEWVVNVNDMIEKLSDVWDIIDEYGDDLPDEFPNKISLKKFITENVTGWISGVINKVKRQLRIDQMDINDYDDLINQSTTLSEFVQMIIEYPINEILEKNMFETFNEEHNNIMTETFNISRNDISSMHIDISSIRESYFDSLDDE